MEYLFKNELIRAEGRYGGGTIRDLYKAYELVHWEVLVKEATAMKFPLKILKMALLAYQAPRRIKLGAAYPGWSKVTRV